MRKKEERPLKDRSGTQIGLASILPFFRDSDRTCEYAFGSEFLGVFHQVDVGIHGDSRAAMA